MSCIRGEPEIVFSFDDKEEIFFDINPSTIYERRLLPFQTPCKVNRHNIIFIHLFNLFFRYIKQMLIITLLIIAVLVRSLRYLCVLKVHLVPHTAFLLLEQKIHHYLLKLVSFNDLNFFHL